MKRSVYLGLALTALSLALHFAPIWENMLNRGAETWDEQPLPYDYLETVIAAHSDGSDPAFARRPLTTWSIGALNAIGLTPKQGFITIGLLGFLLSGMLVFGLARQVGAGERTALLSQALFHGSPTVLMAWFDPLYTYDEPLQYAALLLALLLLLRARWVAFAMAFAVALLARETSLLLLPVFVLLAPDRRAALLAGLLGVAVLAVWLALAPMGASAPELTADLARRSGYAALNFSRARIGETIGFLLLVLALPLFVALRGPSAVPAPWRRGFLLALLLNTPLVLVGAYAREARLLALPLIVLWPWLGAALHAEVQVLGGWRAALKALLAPWKAFALIVLGVGITFAAYRGFRLTAGWPQDNLFHEMLIAQLLLAAALVLAGIRPRPS